MRLQKTLQRFGNQFKTKRRDRAGQKESRRLQLELLETRLAPAVSVINNFDGLVQGGSVPPDTCGAAGPFSYVETVNSAVSIFNKNTGGTMVYFTSCSPRAGSRRLLACSTRPWPTTRSRASSSSPTWT